MWTMVGLRTTVTQKETLRIAEIDEAEESVHDEDQLLYSGGLYVS
jgi:hypothetical protein